MNAPILLLFPALMAYAAASDLLTMTIPNRISLALVAGFAALVLLGFVPIKDVPMHLAAGALVLVACFGMFAAGWMGGGDAKLAAVTALWLGFDPLLDYLLVTAVAGGALTLGLLAMRGVPLPAFALGWTWLTRLHDRKTGIPYGIALAGAALLVYPESPVWRAGLGL
ncbi:A24 family peptidase [Salinarimonas soli]|uniref:Peptidase n=1 Tax=Salinarimonas soli TaxID=1638099 RepID=A0A5B2V638_9HYPH|nr:prepilin peptidase [Salinarimonas soli]KAA2234993.1 peptidase [Salinarimonas soli]